MTLPAAGGGPAPPRPRLGGRGVGDAADARAIFPTLITLFLRLRNVGESLLGSIYELRVARLTAWNEAECSERWLLGARCCSAAGGETTCESQRCQC